MVFQLWLYSSEIAIVQFSIPNRTPADYYNNLVYMTSRDALPEQLSSWVSSLFPNTAKPPGIHEPESGVLVGEIVKLLSEDESLQLSSGTSLMARQANWNALTEPLAVLGVKLTADEKSRLINSSREDAVSVLEKVKAIASSQRKEAEVDITKLDPKKDIRQSGSLLEMMLIALMKSFNLSAKECVTLLSNDGKYLAHILAKGLKGDFGPVENLYNEVNKAVQLMSTLSKDKESKEFIFKILKPGVIAKSQKVSSLALNILWSYLKLIPNPLELFKQAFISTAFLGIRRHKSLLSPVTTLTCQMTEFNSDTFELILANSDDQDLVQIMTELYSQMHEKGIQIQDMKGFTIAMENAVEKAGKISDKQFQNLVLISALIENNERVPLDRLFTNLVELRPKANIVQRTHFIVFLFQSLAALGRSKNTLAPGLYKQLVAMIPDMLITEQNDLFCQNLLTILQEFPKIPINPVIQSFSSGYALHEQIAEILPVHMKLITYLVQNYDLQTKSCLILLDLLTKIQLNNVINSDQINSLICNLVGRFESEEMVQQLMIRFIKISLAIYYANQKKKQPKRKALIPGKNKQSGAEVLLKLKNLVIWKTLDKLLYLKQQFNEQALPLIGFTVVQLKSIGGDRHQHLQKLLAHFGNPEEVVKQYEPQPDPPAQSTHEQFNTVKMKNPSGVRILGVTPKVLQGLQKYHNSYKKKVEKAEAEQKARQEELQRRHILKKSMEVKMLQQGLTLRSNEQIQLLFEFDSRDKIIKLQKPHRNTQVTYFDIDLEQDKDIRALEYTQRRFHKIIRFMYIKYSGSIGQVKVVKDFDEFAQRTQSIKAADIWKMMRQNGLDEYITVFECSQLVKLVNYRSGNKNDPLVLDYTGFEKCLVQLAVFMFSRPPKDMRTSPPALQMEEMFRLMRERCDKNGVNAQLFDDPDTAYFSQGEAIRELNRKLAENPNHILPEGYKKIIEKKVDFEYKLFLQAINPTYKDVFEIIDEVLFDEFNFHILQPFTKVTTKAKARPSLFHMSQTQDIERTRSRSELDSLLPSSKLSQTLRQQVLRFPIRERGIAGKAATALEDIITAIELGHDVVGLKAENTVVKSKKEQLEEERRLQEIENRKRKERQEELKRKLEENKEKKQSQKEAEEDKKRKEEEAKREEEDRRKNKEKELKAKVAEFQTKKKEDEEREKRDAEEKKAKEREDEARKKREAEELKRKVEEAKKKKEQELKELKAKADEEKKKKKVYEEKLFQQRQKHLKEKIKDYKKSRTGQNQPQSEEKSPESEAKAMDG